ncbi:hypothetical protein SAMD00023353_1500980 [Rosellinia necatrix]|uniref:Uncharacterized protein n=1 Tax=Rosellinia necatrix TaxID=77044 RepID=A0A1W2TIW1_ROSNE|nr:hypothetical protein SAMD00023353_1500980 [Rosellinia necatrix]
MMMQLFRWLRSPNNEKPLADPPADPPTDPKEPIEEFLKDSKSSNSPPPSYEDSQHVSIRTVLQGARKAAPLLWPSALCPSPPSSVATPRHEYASAYRFTEATGGKPGGEKKGGGVMKAVASAEEIAMLEVLARLAMAQCGDHTFLDAMRRFSDAYFAPATAPATATRREAAVIVAAARLRERQRRALDAVGAPRDSATLVLCGRVLEEYYAGLGHVDPIVMTTATTMTTAASTPTSRRRPETDRKGGAPLPRAGTGTGTEAGMKTRLSQIAGCEEPGCVCADFDIAPHPHPHPHPRPHSQPTSAAPAPAYTCACGHARASHTLFRAGLARLLRRYTNWDPRPYAALGHRSPRGRRKHGPREIRACGADHDPDHGHGGEEGKDRRRCPCRDYDHCASSSSSSSSSGGGSCARCGHDSVAHIPPDAAAREMPPRQGRAEDHDGDGGRLAGASRSGGGGSSSSGSGSGGLAHNRCRWAEWDLSWILVENAFLLLSRQIAPSSSLECSGSI